jgi:SAM-dependent methyltransferase
MVRTSMEYFQFSPRTGELPTIIEEVLAPGATQLYLLADGTKTLREIKASFDSDNRDNRETFLASFDTLTCKERQLIKLAPPHQPLDGPYKPHNSVPRNLFHSAKWSSREQHADDETIIDFHRRGIENSEWEFDWIEPTLNHAFRFPSEVLNGLDYGSRFCISTLTPEVVSLINKRDKLAVLEVGGGTGSFALAFNKQAEVLKQATPEIPELIYHIVDLSPELAQGQKILLRKLSNPIAQFQQNAVALNLPDYKFDLIIANEVIADFPTAFVRRVQPSVTQVESASEALPSWDGEGASYINKYQLPVLDAPDCFHVNSGVFEFIERVWDHLASGGTAILSEYGGNKYPVLMRHLNHDEYSIHFGHVTAVATQVGFDCRLLTLKEFLGIDDEVMMLDGSAEHIACLNHVLNKFDLSLPYAAISKKEFEERFQAILEQAKVAGISFSPLKSGFHYGPDPNQFKLLLMIKPE